MSNLKRWRRMGQGQFHKWETPGDELEGAWQGSHEGRYGPLGSLETPVGLLTSPSLRPCSSGFGASASARRC
jgi:hypothetical protein